MQETPIQILEVRRADHGPAVTITLTVVDVAARAMFTALGEQLDRRRYHDIDDGDAVLALREQIALVERFEPLAAAGAHSVLELSDSELRACLLGLTDYAQRVDGDHFQPVELRDRLTVLSEITPVLWDANAAAAAAGAQPEAASLP